jgi:ubiquinone/menaquinone biosynthesis C-methylase UbiE
MKAADNPFRRLLEASAPERAQLYEECYNLVEPTLSAAPPSRRRLRRLNLWSRIMRGLSDVLEIGCGTGDLTAALVDQGQNVTAIDISARRLELAAQRMKKRPDSQRQARFIRMNAVALDFPASSFDGAISTSLIEHLHPADVDTHLAQVRRVLRPGGIYAIWCPNRLGHHKDREFHLTMMSYAELIERAVRAGFSRFSSPFFFRGPMVGAGFKVTLENLLTRAGVRAGWTHMGVRNIMLVAKADGPDRSVVR